MKRVSSLIVAILLVGSTTAFAVEETKPITRIMLARLGRVLSIGKNIAYSNYEDVAKDANELAAQTKKVGEAAANPYSKEKNLAISSLSLALADAAAKKDGVTASAKLGEILGTCNTCHAKLRDK
jgi:cytochrome c556